MTAPAAPAWSTDRWFNTAVPLTLDALRGPLVAAVHAATRGVWARANLGHGWREEARAVARSNEPVREALRLMRRLRGRTQASGGEDANNPMRAAFLVRDNFRQRRAIERSYVEAIRGARERVDIAVPYFYPGRAFRRALRQAARRGVAVRLLLQGKIDYRIAALAARALYAELRGHGVPFVVADDQRERVEELREQDLPAVWGDPVLPEVLVQAHVREAAVLLVTLSDVVKLRSICVTARTLNPGIRLLIQGPGEDELQHLADEFGAETFAADVVLAQHLVRHVLEGRAATPGDLSAPASSRTG